MGNLDRTANNEKSLKLSVSEIVTAQHFNPSTFRDDLAILFLNQSIPKNFSRTEIIELNQNLSLDHDVKCLATGWGLTEKVNLTNKCKRNLNFSTSKFQLLSPTYKKNL